MEKRLTTFHGHTNCIAFDPATASFYQQPVASDFASQPALPPKACTTIKASPPPAKPRRAKPIGRLDREVDVPQEHPRFV
jgi:hypothetical protein